MIKWQSNKQLKEIITGLALQRNIKLKWSSKFDIHKTLTVYPLPGFYYTTDYEVAKAYFRDIKN